MGAAVRKIGNSAGVILPKPILEALGAKVGDTLELTLEGDVVRISARKRKVREGWEEDAKRLAALGLTEEEREWLDAPIDYNEDWEW